VIATETSDARVYPVAKGLSEGQFHYTTPGLLQIGKDLGNTLIKAAGLDVMPEKVSSESGQQVP
jgi:hypothetical protein